jgi:hypothetical protein
MIYVVLGMHKSGTSLIARTLHESGIDMGELDGAATDYDRGQKYERAEALAINRALLAGLQRPHLDLPLSRSASFWRFDEATAPIDQRALVARLAATPERRRMRELIARCNDGFADWGFKDPRTCLTYPAWAAELPAHRLVVIYRSFVALLVRLATRRVDRVPGLNLLRLRAILESWMLHNRRILDYVSAGTAPAFVIGYERLMADAVLLERLASFTGRAPVDLREPALYRNRVSHPMRLPMAARSLLPVLSADPRAVLAGLERAATAPSQNADGPSSG